MLADYLTITKTSDKIESGIKKIEKDLDNNKPINLDLLKNIYKQNQAISKHCSQHEELYSYLSEITAKSYIQIKANFIKTGNFTFDQETYKKEALSITKNKAIQTQYIQFMQNIHEYNIKRISDNNLEYNRLLSAYNHKEKMKKEYLVDIDNKHMTHKFTLSEIERKIQLIKGWLELTKEVSFEKKEEMILKQERLRLMKDRMFKDYALDDKEYDVYKEDLRIFKTKLYKARIPYNRIDDEIVKELFMLEKEWRSKVTMEALQGINQFENREQFIDKYVGLVKDYYEDREALGEIFNEQVVTDKNGKEYLIITSNDNTYIGNIRTFTDKDTQKKVIKKISELKKADNEKTQSLYLFEDEQGLSHYLNECSLNEDLIYKGWIASEERLKELINSELKTYSGGK